jgi:hypothetical protein
MRALVRPASMSMVTCVSSDDQERRGGCGWPGAAETGRQAGPERCAWGWRGRALRTRGARVGPAGVAVAACHPGGHAEVGRARWRLAGAQEDRAGHRKGTARSTSMYLSSRLRVPDSIMAASSLGVVRHEPPTRTAARRPSAHHRRTVAVDTPHRDATSLTVRRGSLVSSMLLDISQNARSCYLAEDSGRVDDGRESRPSRSGQRRRPGYVEVPRAPRRLTAVYAEAAATLISGLSVRASRRRRPRRWRVAC